MALTETRPDTDDASAGEAAISQPGAVERLIGSGDHVAIGRLFIGFGLALASLSLTLWAVTGIDALTDNGFLGGRTPQLTSSAQTALLFLGVVPTLLGVFIAVVPLQLGSPSIAFPRAVALSFWTWLVAGGIFAVSIAIDGGVMGGDETAATLGNAALGAVLVALGLGAVCVATTVMAHRPLGMRLAWVPGLSWSALVASSLWLVTLGAAAAHMLLGQVAKMGPAALATNFSENLIWVFRGPAVFAFAIPVLGIAVDVVATATGRRFANTDAMQMIIGLYAILAFGAWAQLPTAINTAMWTLFVLAIAVPILAMVGAIGAHPAGHPHDFEMRTFAPGVEARLDRVQGAAHFDVEPSRAFAIIDALRVRLPGYLVPRLVREMAGAPSKIPAELDAAMAPRSGIE